MKVFVTRPMTPAAEATIRARFDASFRQEATPLTQEESVAALCHYDGIIPTLGDDFGAGVFTQAAERGLCCRILANFGAGYNHIDTAAARQAGVVVTNTPDAVTEATADLAMMLILMSARRASEGERVLRAGKWRGWTPTQFLGQGVSGKRLAVIGMGRIGKAIARRAYHGFGMEVVYFNRSVVSSLDIPARSCKTLTEALTQADFTVLAVRGGEGSHHLIGGAELAAMPAHAHLINISRGDVVDEAALISALQSRAIAGAGLDVYEQEPHVPAALLACENATLLPHLGTAVEDVRTEMALRALRNLETFATGARPHDQVS